MRLSGSVRPDGFARKTIVWCAADEFSQQAVGLKVRADRSTQKLSETQAVTNVGSGPNEQPNNQIKN